ncbi:MAG: Uma2 family endonuclease [Bryobacteraceae bacterium]
MAAAIPLSVDLASLKRVVLRPPTGFSDDDLLEFCGEHPYLHIEQNAEGDLIVAPCGFDSGFIGSEIFGQLREWARKDGRGMAVAADTGFRLPDKSLYSPDAAWIPSERVKGVPREKRRVFPTLVPAFVIEVRSPSDRKKELHQKMLTYLRNGVELGWLIDPEGRAVAIYRSDQERPIELADPDHLTGEGPVAGFVLHLKQIYDQLA